LYAASFYLLSHLWSTWDNNCMHLILQNDLTESTDSDSDYCWPFYPTWSLKCQTHLAANPSAQNADHHLALPGRHLLTCENESCELTDHSSTFYSLSFPKLRSRNFCRHNNTSSSCQEEGYKFAICKFPHSTNFLPFFVRGLCCKPHFNRNWQILCALFHNSEKYNASNNRHKAICLAIHGGFYGHDSCLGCKQHVLSLVLSMREMTYHPSDDNSFSI